MAKFLCMQTQNATRQKKRLKFNDVGKNHCPVVKVGVSRNGWNGTNGEFLQVRCQYPS